MNNLACVQVRTDVLLAMAPVPDGRENGVNTLICTTGPTSESIGTMSLSATDEFPAQKSAGTSLDYLNINLDPRIVTIWYEPVGIGQEPNYSDWTFNGFILNAAGAPLGPFRCDTSTLLLCIDGDSISVCAYLEDVAGQDRCGDTGHRALWTHFSVAKNVPIANAGYIADPTNDNTYKEGSFYLWKIRDPMGDGSVQISFPVEGLTIGYEDGAWVVQSSAGQRIMVDHEPANNRWAIRLL